MKYMKIRYDDMKVWIILVQVLSKDLSESQSECLLLIDKLDVALKRGQQREEELKNCQTKIDNLTKEASLSAVQLKETREANGLAITKQVFGHLTYTLQWSTYV